MTAWNILRLKLTPKTAGGIRPRPHALLTGPSGVGKTALVFAFAENALKKRDFSSPVFACDGGTWIPDGARQQPNTLYAIKRWLRQVEQYGIIYLDELDKLFSGPQQEWSRSVVQNIQALLDNRLDSVDYWTREDSRILDEKILIIGSGTWQKLQREVLSYEKMLVERVQGLIRSKQSRKSLKKSCLGSTVISFAWIRVWSSSCKTALSEFTRI
jgi:Cdc6-like AAA superfamily ATPase